MSNPSWEKIREDWETSDKTLKQLAQDWDLKISTVRSRKSREKWVKNATLPATSQRNVATQRKKKKKPKPKYRTVPRDVEEEYQVSYEGFSDELNERQKLFCMYYIKYWNATKAYKKAYPGVKESTAWQNGSKLLKHAKVTEELERLKKEKFGRIGLDANALLQRWVDIAFADITDFMEFGVEEIEEKSEESGETETHRRNFVRFRNADEVDGALISEVRQGKDGVAIKLEDKMKALDTLTKYYDLLGESTKRKLQEEKLKVEVATIQKDAQKKEESQNRKTIIVTDKEEMRRVMNERNRNKGKDREPADD